MAQTLEEIKELAESMWEGCHGCDETDKHMWINGFVTGYLTSKTEQTMAQQTAMQKLLTNLESIDIKIPQGIKDIYLQMEKEQIIDAYLEGESDGEHLINSAEQYYNETYGE